MSNTTPENTQDENKEGLGLMGKVAAAAGGVALGALAQKTVVDRSLVSNLVKPYAEGVEAFGKTMNTAEFTGTAEFVRNNAEQALNAVNHQVHDAVKDTFAAGTASDSVKALFDDKTTLGAARKKIIDAAGSEASMAKGQAEARAVFDKLSAEATKVAGATTDAARTAASEDMMKLILKEAEQTNRANIASKVKEVSWLKKLNPFSGDLHLSGKQKTVAIVAATASIVVGYIGISSLAKWMGGGKDETPPM